jgi:hypothetical protein
MTLHSHCLKHAIHLTSKHDQRGGGGWVVGPEAGYEGSEFELVGGWQVRTPKSETAGNLPMFGNDNEHQPRRMHGPALLQ